MDKEIRVAIVKHGSVTFDFNEEGFGFGRFRFYYKEDKTKTLMLDNEAIGKSRIKKYLCAFVDQAQLEIGA